MHVQMQKCKQMILMYLDTAFDRTLRAEMRFPAAIHVYIICTSASDSAKKNIA